MPTVLPTLNAHRTDSNTDTVIRKSLGRPAATNLAASNSQPLIADVSVGANAGVEPYTRTADRLMAFDPASSREALIATAAYYRAEQRGFAPGHEVEDWLAAEQQIDGMGARP